MIPATFEHIHVYEEGGMCQCRKVDTRLPQLTDLLVELTGQSTRFKYKKIWCEDNEINQKRCFEHHENLNCYVFQSGMKRLDVVITECMGGHYVQVYDGKYRIHSCIWRSA